MDDSTIPSASLNSNASHVLMMLGRFDEAKKLLDQLWQRGPLLANPAAMRYELAFFENDSAVMGRLARETPADDARLLSLQVRLAFLHGDFGKLRSLSETLVKQQTSAKRMENVADLLAWHAWLESYVGNYALARKLCRQAAQASGDSADALDYCAKALGEAGEAKQAEMLAAKKDRLHPEDTRNLKMRLPETRSIIERTRGNAVKAVELLEPVVQYEQGCSQIPYYRATAYQAARESKKAAAEFQKIIGYRGWDDWEIFTPLAQLGLARTYAMQGDRENSRKAYDDFFTTWKDADPDIPILRQAKSEYKKLQATASTVASASGTPR